MTSRPDLPAGIGGTVWHDRPQGVDAALAALIAGPDPDATATRLARVLESAPRLAAASRSDSTLALRLVAICGAGRALAGIAANLGDAALEPLRATVPPSGAMTLDGVDPAAALRRQVGARLLAIAGLDLVGAITMPTVGAALSDLADQAARAALDLAVAATDTTVAVIALGKWGGRELNYASDIDLVFVHEGDDADAAAAVATRFIALMAERTDDGVAFRVDADLRPEGAAGPLSRTLDSYTAYWRQWAQTWEFQAMLKARHAAGDERLASAFLDAVRPFVHPESLGGDAVREIRAMKARAERLVTGPDELKRGVGGIRDVEFAIQLLQLVHGRADPELRAANTLEALERLGEGGYVRLEDAAALAAAYQWLRDVEHRIQLQDLRQTHSIPTDPAARTRLAKVMGYRDRPAETALNQFEADLVRYRTEVRGIHERLFYRPLLEAFAAAAPAEKIDRQLVALGFTDSAAAQTAVADLTTGLSRRSRLMQQLLPLMMEWLSASPDPDLGLAQLRLLVIGEADNAALVGALRDNPGAGERLCRLLGTARTAGRLLDRLPAMLPRLGDDAALAAPQRSALVAAAIARSETRDDHRARTLALHRFWSEHLVTTIAADVGGLIDVVEVGHRLSDAADALVAGLLASAMTEVQNEGRTPPPLAVMALGKWGGGELTYASDLDGLIVFAPSDGPHDTATAVRVAELLVESLASSPLGLPPPQLDLDLRPEGKKGVIARSLPSYREYWERWALTWEHQALLRCRTAAGDPDLGAGFVAAADRWAYPEHLGVEQVREIRAMKARVEQERIPLGEDPDFHVKLGRGALADVEWAVQLLQMQHGHAAPELRGVSTLQTLEALRIAGAIDAGDAAALDTAYRFCATVRNRLYLRAGRPRDSLPTDPLEAAAVARSLGYDLTPRTALRQEYRRVTRRARRVVERVFYGA